MLKKILLLAALVSSVVLAAGVYRFNFTHDDIYVVQENGQVVPLATQDNTSVMRTLFSIYTDKYWQIELPDSGLKVPLTELKNDNGQHFALGRYHQGEERGVVRVDYPRITVLNFTFVEDEMMFAVPFSVSNQGSGVFWYLGLFQMNTRYGDIKQLDTLWVGDRVVITALNTDEPFDVTSSLQLSYLKHSVKQSMAEKPVEVIKTLLEVTPTGFVK
ncbi:hypothetical protein [Photobacterium kagoshimensis]|uniref:hypothetical protein n=1 Tax=Photobacterium kagoshimensis TaxID=2910242 RepID=UPI003D09AC7B